jgi:DNA-directed RNA polymerase subunit K/omega
MTDNLHKSEENHGDFLMTSTLINRVRELMDGAPALIETKSSDYVKIAFEEFANGKISIPEDVVKSE